MKPDRTKKCELCETSPQGTRHHLWPKQLLPKNDVKRRSIKVMLCLGCHGLIHTRITNRQMFDFYNSIERLRKHPTVAIWIQAKKQDPSRFTAKGFERTYPAGHAKHKLPVNGLTAKALMREREEYHEGA